MKKWILTLVLALLPALVAAQDASEPRAATRGDVLDAFKATIVSRPSVQSLIHYAQDSRNWSPRFMTLAAIVGGAVGYLDGIHVSAPVGKYHLKLGIASGLDLQQRVSSGQGGLGHLEICRAANSLCLQSSWSLKAGQPRAETIAMRYQVRF